MSRNAWIAVGIMGSLFVLVVGLGIGVLVGNMVTESSDESAVADTGVIAAATETRSGLPAPPTQEITPTPSNTPTETPLPTETSAPTETPTPTGTPVPTETPVDTATPTETATNTPTPTATPTETPTPSITPTREGPLAEASEDAGFFAGPGVEYGRANYFAKSGEIMVLLGADENQQWVHVISNENSFEGWVSARFLKLISGDLASLPISTYRGKSIGAVPTSGSGSSSGGGGAPVGGAYFSYIEGSALGNGDGTWSGEILIIVPTGYEYTFEFGEEYKGDARRTVTDRDGNDEYVMPITAGCGGALVRNMKAYQNGVEIPVYNLYTNEQVGVYIDYSCSG